MRRIYDSDALVRDDRPHTPTDRDGAGRAMIDWTAASHALMPVALRDRAIAVQVETDRASYPPGQPVGIRITLRNRLPVPVTLRTSSTVGWRWAVDGHTDASRCEPEISDRRGTLEFARRERKRFVRRWRQSIQQSPTSWDPVPPGTYTIAAWVDVDDPANRGLRGETTVTITPS